MPRSASETKTTLFVSESECQAGRLTERYLFVSPCKNFALLKAGNTVAF